MKAIVATSPNGGIGFDNNLLYRDAKDMKIFKDTTKLGCYPYIIMGKKTFESIGRPLPDRRNYVITKDDRGEERSYWTIDYTDERYYEWLYLRIKDNGPMCNVIGGAKVYWGFLPFISRIVDNRFKENPGVPADKYFLYPEGCETVSSNDCGNFVSRLIINEPLFLKNMKIQLNSSNYLPTSRAYEDYIVPLPYDLNYEMTGNTDMIRPIIRQLIHFANEKSPEFGLFRKRLELIPWVNSECMLYTLPLHHDTDGLDKMFMKLYLLHAIKTLFSSAKCTFNDIYIDKQLVDVNAYNYKNKLHILTLADEILYQIIDVMLIEIYDVTVDAIDYRELLKDGFDREVNSLSDIIRDKLLEAFESYVTENY